MAFPQNDAASGAANLQEFPFALHPSVDQYKDPYQVYLQKQPYFETKGPRPIKLAISWMIVGALTFHPVSSVPRILIIQRSATDSMPHRWEIPGGGCDDTDKSILHGVARELEEEAGLKPRLIGPAVGPGYIFQLSRGRSTRKVNFVVEVERSSVLSDGETVDVKLDPKEHQAFAWATEEEVRMNRVGDRFIRFTSNEQRNVILDAFLLRRSGDRASEEDQEEKLEMAEKTTT